MFRREALTTPLFLYICKMLSCLTDQIGIRGVCDPKTGKKYYLDNLTGISIYNSDKSIDQKYMNGFNLMLEKIQLASEILAEDFLAMMQNRATTFEPQSQFFTGFINTQLTLNEPLPGYYAGKRIWVWESPYKSVHIQSVSTYNDFTGDIDIKLWDLLQNKLLDTITVASVAAILAILQVMVMVFR